jgi:RimJ/RimL family protein N-acetyltransferase
MRMIETLAKLKLGPPQLLRPNLELRTIKEKDISPAYIKWMNDSDIVKYTEQRFAQTTAQDIKIYIGQMADSRHDLFYGIFDHDAHIGTVKLGAINFRHKTADLSYIIGSKAHWGQGIASLAISTMVQIGFSRLGLMKICAGVYADNKASSRVLEKNGFEIEGIKKSQYLQDNQRVDSVLYGRVSNS